jgi:hypothetical protein
MSAWARPVHHCHGCGIEGRLSLADPDKADPRPILRLDFGGGKSRLLCHLCMVPDESQGSPTPEPVNA